MSTVEKIAEVLKQAKNKKIEINSQTDLLEEKILDSLDSMVFFMLFEDAFDVFIPQDIDLKKEGYYKVAKLIEIAEKK